MFNPRVSILGFRSSVFNSQSSSPDRFSSSSSDPRAKSRRSHASSILSLLLTATFLTLFACSGGGDGGGTASSGGGGTPPGPGPGPGPGGVFPSAQQAYIKASNTQILNEFGMAVALSDDGNTLIVGAPSENSAATGVNGNQTNSGASQSGAAYVFARSGASWVQQTYVKASNTRQSQEFGSSVAISGDANTLAVGAPEEASASSGINGDQTNVSGTGSGAVYVFNRTGGSWAQQAYIKASNNASGLPLLPADQFGGAVALSADGNTLAVGARFEDSNATGVNGDQTNNLASASGAVYVFTRSGATWTQQAYVKASNTNAQDHFGTSVALSADGNILAVGAPDEDSTAIGIDGDQTSNGAAGSGAVYVFVRNGGTWTQQTYVKASNTGPNDAFGTDVTISGDGQTLAVGAGGEGSSATGVNGNQNDNTAVGSGAVYVFVQSGGTWTQQAYLKASNTEADDRFGSFVSLSANGNLLATSASEEDSGATGINGNQGNSSNGAQSGAVYVFRRDGTTWTQQAYVKASNTDNVDRFGTQSPDANSSAGKGLALASDGNTITVGATGESSRATGVNGNQLDEGAPGSGAVYVFQ